MAQIHLLDSETIDKIAAGEVVERPSSVVKELVENAIDAKATAITVEAKEGGIEFIRVTDNGAGIEREQLRRAFLRHATSKIEKAEDLTSISSLGFRGEALSSIAAVSKVEVITKCPDTLVGNRIMLEGAVEKSLEEVGAPDGTTFIVRNLFYNTPVRRKFLKQPATEGGYIADLMEHMALSRPDISFKLVLGNQIRFHTSGNGDLREVIYRIYGRDVANSLIPVQQTVGGITMEGYLGKPVLVRSNRNFEIYFINGRFIKSNVIARALEEGYKEYLMQHKFPFCVLHITMDTSEVDVNVHPTKMDVRFSNTISFMNILTDMVKNALMKREMIPEAVLGDERKTAKQEKTQQSSAPKVAAPEPFEVKRDAAYKVMEASRYDAVRQSVLTQDNTGSAKQQIPDFRKNPVWTRVKEREEAAAADQVIATQSSAKVSVSERKTAEEELFFVEASDDKEPVVKVPDHNSIPAVSAAQTQDNTSYITDLSQMSLFEDKILSQENRARFRMIGQVFSTYWLIQFEEKLLIVDQHAAHEKVKYERLMKQFHENRITSQRLLPPVIVSLSGQEISVLQEHMEVFETLGFEIESFGGNEYAIRSVPTDLYGCSEREMFLEVLNELTESGGRGSLKAVEEKIASMACKAAVKGNSSISAAEAEQLIDELLTLDNPYNCPHGRPTIISMTKSEMEKKFKRIL
ncbi:MAG: DNA mismatch repair endonuclease MutL [Lachnospiraceae bacterium]|nr:DNA mismatch repair endonuclease MutL [Lachnospiraceae bacterium]